MTKEERKNKIKEYRSKHRKCTYCEWYNYNSVNLLYGVADYEECKLKDEMISFNKLKALFCKHYQTRKVDDNEI